MTHVVSVHIRIPASVTSDPFDAAGFALAYLREQRELQLDVVNEKGEFQGSYGSYEFETEREDA